MKVLFDHNLPRRLRPHITGHEISTTREMGWETLLNGLLLQSAADADFDVFVSIDKKIEHEQNLQALPLPIIVLDALSNTLPNLLPLAPFVIDLLSAPLVRLLYIVEPTGHVHRLSSPRQ